ARDAVLHRAEHAAVVVVIDGPPGSELGLGLLDPAPLVHAATGGARLPPDAVVANARDAFERGAGQAGEPRAHPFDSREGLPPPAEGSHHSAHLLASDHSLRLRPPL